MPSSITDTDGEGEGASALISAMSSYMESHMCSHDPSHDPSHVHRVVALAKYILHHERILHPQTTYDPTVVILAALLHDINDRKYSSSASTSGGSSPVLSALLANGASPDLAAKVDKIVTHVSYTAEKRDPEAVRRLICDDGYVELGIVQDADRLDALGAVGVGRCFTYLGASAVRKQQAPNHGTAHDNARSMCTTSGLDDAIEHFGDKLEKLEHMMKTETGKEMARVRTERLRIFRSWWEEEILDSQSRPAINQ